MKIKEYKMISKNLLSYGFKLKKEGVVHKYSEKNFFIEFKLSVDIRLNFTVEKIFFDSGKKDPILITENINKNIFYLTVKKYFNIDLNFHSFYNDNVDY